MSDDDVRKQYSVFDCEFPSYGSVPGKDRDGDAFLTWSEAMLPDSFTAMFEEVRT